MAAKPVKRKGAKPSKSKTMKKVVDTLKGEVTAGELTAIVGGLHLFYDQDERFLRQCREERVGRLMGDEWPGADGLPVGDGVPVKDGIPIMDSPCGHARRRRR